MLQTEHALLTTSQIHPTIKTVKRVCFAFADNKDDNVVTSKGKRKAAPKRSFVKWRDNHFD